MADLKKVFIDSGHSVNDPGAVGYETERKLNIKISKYMHEHLLDTYECLVKLMDETIDSLTVIARTANEWGADIVVSPHMNAGKGNGYESLVYSKSNKKLGQIFEKHVKAIGQNSRGVKYRPGLGLLRLTNAPAIIPEGAFVDNWTDIKDWNDDAELKKLGIAYAKATAEFLDLPLKKKASKTPFKVKVTASVLNIRKGAGTKYKKVGSIKDKGVYTIIEVKGNWGKLKSSTAKSPRWIHLGYTKEL